MKKQNETVVILQKRSLSLGLENPFGFLGVFFSVGFFLSSTVTCSAVFT